MRIGMIGLGDIAQKAYLPVLAAQPGLELHLQTRDAATLTRLGEAYRLPHRHQTLESLIGAGIEAAFVHAATAAHVPIVRRLLAADIHVYVDKPLDQTLEGARDLVERAERSRRSLMVGFNRRHAPEYVAIRQLPRELVLLCKHRADLAGPPRVVVYDDFIHVLDTLRFLAPGPIASEQIHVVARQGRLHQATVTLGGDGFVLVGAMNRMSGGAVERLEVDGPGCSRIVRELTEVTEIDPSGGERVRRAGGWLPVSRQRGIEQACLAFLGALERGELVSARDALVTHELCERVVQAAEA
jgi:virulence factor